MTEITDPLAAIAEVTPSLSDVEAVALAFEQYNLDVEVHSLVSERDQNFQMRAADGQQYVLKIANKSEDPVVTGFQIEALLHIDDYVRKQGVPISAPTVLRTQGGDTHTTIESAGAVHIARVVSYVEGVPVGDRIPSQTLSRNMGQTLAHLGNALREFRHPGSHQKLLWDVQQSLRLRDLLQHIPDSNIRSDVAAALDEFELHVSPSMASLRRQVIHSDFNPDNVLVGVVQPDEVVGVIDFGDMLDAPLAADVAIAASYLRPEGGNPLALIAELIAGYTAVTPLQQAEIDVLFELVKARLCASVALLHWRASFRDADDPYLGKLLGAESGAAVFLGRLNALPREHVVQSFRQVCAIEY